MLSFLRKIFETRWPEGEPIFSAYGQRIGTTLPNGNIIFVGHGLQFTPLPICSRCQQTIKAEDQEARADDIERNSQECRKARV